METSFCLRVDIDTWEGLERGVPMCLKLAEENSFPITFYLSLGKYATGRNLFRIIKDREPIKRKIPVWKRNHWKDLFRGVLTPSKRINDNLIGLLRDYETSQYCEIHPHGYNHVRWANSFNQFNEHQTSEYVNRMIREYTRIFEKSPVANAAPNFVTNSFYTKLLSEKKFKFTSDYIYHSPFILSSDGGIKPKGRVIVQLPVTEYSIEDLIVQGKSKTEIIKFYKYKFEKHVEEGSSYICMYIHAIFEPIRMYKVLEEIIKITESLDIKPLTHSEYYNQEKNLPIKELKEIHQEMQK